MNACAPRDRPDHTARKTARPRGRGPRITLGGGRDAETRMFPCAPPGVLDHTWITPGAHSGSRTTRHEQRRTRVGRRDRPHECLSTSTFDKLQREGAMTSDKWLLTTRSLVRVQPPELDKGPTNFVGPFLLLRPRRSPGGAVVVCGPDSKGISVRGPPANRFFEAVAESVGRASEAGRAGRLCSPAPRTGKEHRAPVNRGPGESPAMAPRW